MPETSPRPSRLPAIYSSALFLILAALQLSGGFIRADRQWGDLLFKWRGMERGDPRVTVVAIDDKSIEEVGQYPWPRSVYKRLLEGLYAAGVEVAGLDFLFINPSRPEEDRVLVEATRAAGPRLVHAISLDPKTKGTHKFIYPFPALKEAAASLGIVTQPFIDTDGHVREVTFFIAPQPRGDGDYRDQPGRMPSFGLAVLSRFLGRTPEEVVAGFPSNSMTLNVRGVVERPVGRVDVGGERRQILVEDHGIARVSAADVIAGRLDQAQRARLKGGIALVGSTAQAAFDHFPTPFSELSPGVEVHANMIDNLLNGRWLRRTPQAVVLGVMLAMTLAASFLIGLGTLPAVLLFLAMSAAWVWTTYAAFLRLRLLDFAGPMAAFAGTFLGLLVHKTLLEERQKREVRRMFGQYVAPEVVDILVKDPDKIRLGGQRRDMTVFFLDIAHFTTIAEKLRPEALIQFLNHYLSALTDVVLKHKGVVDKYIGDCVMAFWNAPLEEPDHRRLACLAAAECVETLERLNREYKEPLPERPAVRIGINSGEMVVGNTGSARKLAYTVLGDEVNLGSRLEGANKFFGSTVMVSENTFSAAADAVEGRLLGKVRVVGKAVPIKVYEILGRKGALPAAWREALPAYERGVALFLKKDFAAAAAEFRKVLAALPGDGPARLYLGLSEDYQRLAPPADWEGVFNLTAK